MRAMASQITSLTTVYSAVYSGADERKHQSSASLAVTGEFPAQRASNAENVSIWWRHHVVLASQFQSVSFPHKFRITRFDHCTPLWKVIGIFFLNQIWSRSLDINRLCLVCVKRSVGEVKKCQISKRNYQQGPSDEALKKARCQFCDVKFGHRIMEAWVSLTIKCAILPKLL